MKFNPGSLLGNRLEMSVTVSPDLTFSKDGGVLG